MEKNSKCNQILRWIALYIFAVSLLAVPLYMHNGYFDLIEAKAGIYLKLTIPALISAFLTLVVDGIRKYRTGCPIRQGLYPIEILLLAIGGWSLIDSVLSGFFKASFLGVLGWAAGSALIVTSILSTICLFRFLRFDPRLMIPVIVINIGIFVMAVMQSANMDPFHLLAPLQSKFYYAYLGTIGQKNSFSGYLCLLMPLFWGFFITCTDVMSEIVYLVISAGGLLSFVLCESDSAYAGLGLCVVFMLPYVFGKARYVGRSGVLLLFYGLSLLIVGRLPAFALKTAKMKDLSAFLVTVPCAAGISIAALLIMILGYLIMPRMRQENVVRLLILLESVLIGAICITIVYTGMHFKDSWGTNRGILWRTGWEYFRKLPLLKKLTGIGPDMAALVYLPLRKSMGVNFTSAHNEPLQILLTEGIVGLALYLAFWIVITVGYFKKRLWKRSDAVFAFPLAAYLGQSMFCTVYPVTAAAFSVILALYLKVLFAGEVKDEQYIRFGKNRNSRFG